MHAESIKLGANHPRVRMVRSSIEVAEKPSVATQDEMQIMLLTEERMAELRANLAAKRAAEAFNPAHTDTAQPLCAGKTFDQWLQVIQTERSIIELAQALDAIGVLGRGKHDRQAARAILDLIAQYPYANPMRTDADDRARLSVAAIRSMRGLNADETLPSIVDGFIDRQPSVHEFVLEGLLSGEDTVFVGPAREQTYLGMTQPLCSKLRASEPLTGSNPRFESDSLGDLTTKERPSGVTIANMPKFVAHEPDE